MAGTPVGSNALIPEVLDRYNYKNWRSRLETYLLAEDLWGVVEAIEEPSTVEDDQAKYKAWTIRNAKALYAIHNSCGELFGFIREIKTAKGAWEALEQECKVVQAIAKETEYDENNADHLVRFEPFIQSVISGDWDKAKKCLGEVDVRSIAVKAVGGWWEGTTTFHLAAWEGTTTFHLAAWEGHAHIVKELVHLMTPEDLKTKNINGHTALHLAAQKGHVHVVKELPMLLMGEVKDKDGDTALHIAVQEEKFDVVKELVLLMRQEGLQMKNDAGYTAFHLAVNKGNMPMVKEFVTKERGENNIGEADFERYIPFTTCVYKGDWDKANECLRELDDPCAAVTAVDPRDDYGDTALHVAARKRHLNVIKGLVSLLKTRQEDHLELKTAGDFITFGSGVSVGVSEELLMERAKYMVEQYEKTLGYSLGVQNFRGDTALRLAVWAQNVDIVRELAPIMTQEGLELKDNNGSNALHLAVSWSDRIDIVQVLVPLFREEGLEIKDDDGNTPLNCAVLNGNVNTVKELAQWMRQEGLENALHLAVGRDRIDVVKVLVPLFRKEGLEIKDDDGDTALNRAVLNGNLDMVKELVRSMRQEGLEIKNNKGSNALHLAVTEEHIEIVKELIPLMRTEAVEMKNAGGDTPLNCAVLRGNLDMVKELVRSMRQEGLEIKNIMGSSALHLAVTEEHIEIVKELILFMRPEGLEEKDGDGVTALSWAIQCFKDEDVCEIAKLMVEKGHNVLGIPSAPNNDIPVVNALRWNKWKSAFFIYSVTSQRFLEGPDGVAFICYSFNARRYTDLAWDLLQRYPVRFMTRDERAKIMMIFSGMNPAFLSGSQLTSWQRWLYDRVHVEMSPPHKLHEVSINIAASEYDDDKNRDLISSVLSFFRRIARGLRNLCGIQDMYELKKLHQRIFYVLRCIGEATMYYFPEDELEIVKSSIFSAIQQGNYEFVTQIFKGNPALLDRLSGQAGKGIFHLAIENRQKEVFSLIYGLKEKERHAIGLQLVNKDNNLLHYAANLSSHPQFGDSLDASLQMQRELQWFKEVERVVPSEMYEHRNRSNNMTARELFTINHMKLMDDAETSINKTATSCTVVGTLIVTVMFAAAFTVPGGNNGNTGLPMFRNRKLFNGFIISDIISLVSSTSSVIAFLGILTSRFAEDDLFESLLKKMMFGLITLFFSIASMMIAFSCALIIMLEGKRWIVALSILTSVPVILFVWLLFPLLIKTFKSTYGSEISEIFGKRKG